MSGDSGVGDMDGGGAASLRGMMLRESGHYAEAMKMLGQALESDPDDAFAHFQIALCYMDWKNQYKLALRHLDRALAIHPNSATYLSTKAIVMSRMGKHRQAMQLADQALAIDVADSNALNVRSMTHDARCDWREMETSARHSLEIDPTDLVAANFLAVALRHQRRLSESEQVTADILARTPNDAWAQSNAGWSALQAGNYFQANRQFLEALRLNPQFAPAREGLLHSFNARIPFYRWYFRVLLFSERFHPAYTLGAMVVFYLSIRYVGRGLRAEWGHLGSEVTWLAIILIGVGIFNGRAIGNFFLLFHPVARHALTAEDRSDAWQAAGVAALVFLGSLWLHLWSGIVLIPVFALCFIISLLTAPGDLQLER